ncbi:MAG: histidinol-phosphate transaminase [Cyclobacteriaceae bacterium]|nr:histidinol-phosphate transaminase [Cyclobacteriaceae bacterium]MBX2916226.1 histidinol-phosphate transaminase [Cyclobacteriaceae bacterium]
MFDLQKLVRKNVLNLKPYSSARDEFQGQASVYLDANENPFETGYNRYPDPHQVELKKKLGHIKKVNPENIFLGNGSDEPIDLLFRACCEPGIDNVVIPQPTYGMYTVSANINNVAIKTINLTNQFDVDVEQTLTTCDTNTKLIFLCSPNNPSGNLLTQSRIEKILSEFKGLVIVDEAYIDFTDYNGFVPLLNRYPNLVVLQTLSKAWGLAAIRLGICFASKEIIQVLNKIKAPYNISLLSQKVASEALDKETEKNKWVKQIIEERSKLQVELQKLKTVQHVYPSDANFLLVKISAAAKVYQKLVERGVIVRDRSNVVLCDNCLRITVGTPTENQILIRELSAL